MFSYWGLILQWDIIYASIRALFEWNNFQLLHVVAWNRFQVQFEIPKKITLAIWSPVPWKAFQDFMNQLTGWYCANILPGVPLGPGNPAGPGGPWGPEGPEGPLGPGGPS